MNISNIASLIQLNYLAILIDKLNVHEGYTSIGFYRRRVHQLSLEIKIHVGRPQTFRHQSPLRYTANIIVSINDINKIDFVRNF